MEINYDSLLERSNLIKNEIEKAGSLDEKIITWKEQGNKWSVIEVVSHLNQVYKIYLDTFELKIGEANSLLPTSIQPKKSTLIGKIAIYTNRPRKEKIRYKLKTFDFFQPVTETEDTAETSRLFFENKSRFNAIIKSAKSKDVANVKIATALGKRVKFYIPECLDFLISHEERHLVQIHQVLNKQNTSISVGDVANLAG